MLVTGIHLLFAYPENHVEIRLVILFSSRKKFHAKQTFVLSSTMKLGPGLELHGGQEGHSLCCPCLGHGAPSKLPYGSALFKMKMALPSQR